jgi:membrane-associated protein
MQAIIEFIHRLGDPRALVAWGGYVGLTIIIFAETGLLIGFFLPGDSLLVTAGLLATQAQLVDLNVYVLGVLLSVASIVGNALGYYIGKVTGPHLFARENSLLFNRKHLERAHAFYERHGGKTIVIARFMPIVRTFVPVVAGMGQMQYRRYMAYNMIGGLAWIWSMLFIGYFLGRYIPGVSDHIELVILIVIFLSFLPAIVAWLRSRGRSTERRAVSDI